ncbi:MAG: tetratricopeptide repeat protein [Candidatus Eiseniibacteriota bacterium]|jgi:tetratricopeptide (TPR) repeat protein
MHARTNLPTPSHADPRRPLRARPRSFPVFLIALALALVLAGGAGVLLAGDTDDPDHDEEQAQPAATGATEEPAASREAEAREQQSADERSVELEASRRERRGPSADPREQLIDSLEQELESDPENADVHYKLANAYQDAGYLHSALRHYNEAVRIDASHSRAWNNRGSVLKELNRHDQAIESFHKALEINPEDVMAIVNLGDEYLLQKRYQQAVDQYRSALKIDPEFVNAFYSMAITFAETGMYRDAARAWRQAAELAVDQQGDDSSIAKRATENAKLMEDIVADAQKQIEKRKALEEQLGAQGEGQGGEAAGSASAGAKNEGGDASGAGHDHE